MKGLQIFCPFSNTKFLNIFTFQKKIDSYIMKSISILLLFFLSFCSLFGQKKVELDSLQLKNTDDFFADDYGNIYLYKENDFSFTKYDSLGKQQAKIMLTVPFRVQGVNNPLNIFLFSENSQELKVLDQNLNEIQTIDFKQKFGFVKSAYTEDLQQIWLLDESSKRLIQYNYRQDQIINAYPIHFNFDRLIGILVYKNGLYTINEKSFSAYQFNGNKTFEIALENPIKLSRDNDYIYLIEKNKIQKFEQPNKLKTVFYQPNAQIVDKNSTSYFELNPSKLYLYKFSIKENQ